MKRMVSAIVLTLMIAATVITTSCTSREERLVREAGREAERLMNEAADRAEDMMKDL
ncbi:MAG: hypothetical protein ACLFNT_02875 [Spirochaetales bacterium]